jgi:replicative DNA helicase
MENHIKEKLKQIIDDITLSDLDKKIAIQSVLRKIHVPISPIIEPLSLSKSVDLNFDFWSRSKYQTLYLETGWNSLNYAMGYVGKGEIVVFGGRPGMGKTRLLIQLALSMSRKNKVLFHSLDLDVYTITNYFISSIAEIPIRELTSNELSDDEKIRLEESKEQLKEFQISITSDTINSFDDVFDFYKKLIVEQGIQVICIDYLQLISNYYFHKSRDMEITLFLRTLKNFAKEHKVTFLITSQLNRSVEIRGGDHRPYLSDLRESGSIEEYADKVLLIYRPEYYQLLVNEEGDSTLGVIELNIAKNNTGKLDAVLLHSNHNFTRFLEDFTWKK